MTAHKFVYTVSGVELTEAQKSRISEGIAATVTRELLGGAPEALDSAYLAEHPLCGGSHIRDEDAPASGVPDESAAPLPQIDLGSQGPGGPAGESPGETR